MLIFSSKLKRTNHPKEWLRQTAWPCTFINKKSISSLSVWYTQEPLQNASRWHPAYAYILLIKHPVRDDPGLKFKNKSCHLFPTLNLQWVRTQSLTWQFFPFPCVRRNVDCGQNTSNLPYGCSQTWVCILKRNLTARFIRSISVRNTTEALQNASWWHSAYA